MTANHHTPITAGAAARVAVLNIPLGQLDAAITAYNTSSEWSVTGSDTYYSTGNVGIGVGFPGESINGPFRVHDGGINQILLLDSGGYLDVLGVVNEGSDVNAKENFSPIDNKEILARLIKIPITTWSFKRKPTVRHMGSTAQDFHAAFGLGRDNRHIALLDTNGVAIAAIQALYQMAQERNSRIARLRKQSIKIKKQLKKLEQFVSENGMGECL